MRIFYKTGSTITEFTDDVKKYSSGTKNITIGVGDAIYIASDFPFNHLYFKLGTNVSAQSRTMSVSYYSDNAWEPVVHLNDQTNEFAQSGFIEFTPDRDESWEKKSTNYGGDVITELSSIVVYDQYWTKITFDGALDGVDFNWIGNLFSVDEDLYSEFPIFNDSNFLTAFASGKTNWQEQHVKASELVIQDLKRKNVIFGAEQLLDRDIFMPASVSKVAEILFNSFGRDYNDSRDRAREEYNKRMDLSRFLVDSNNDAIKDEKELKAAQGWLSR